MANGTKVPLAVLIILVMSVTASAFSKRPAVDWNYYHFDGHAFIAGQPADGTPFLALRDGTLPVVLTRPAKIEAMALSSDTGAIAGICYIQTSGGKLATGSGYVTSPLTSMTFTSGTGRVTNVRSDKYGYFIETLPVGTYKVQHGALTANARVENGSTVLVPLRVGKRMVD